MYFFYIDESGSRDLKDDDHRFFVLGALGISGVDWSLSEFALNTTRLAYFRADVEIKSTWLRNPKARKAHYLDPAQLSEEEVSKAVDKIYDLLDTLNVVYFACVVDKVRLREKLFQLNYSPGLVRLAYYGLASMILDFLTSFDPPELGVLVHDIIDDRMKQEDTIHKYLLTFQRDSTDINWFKRLGLITEETISKVVVETDREAMKQLLSRPTMENAELLVGGIHFVPSHQTVFLQVADLLAYNVLRQFEKHGHEWDEASDIYTAEKYEYFEKNATKVLQAFRQHIEERRS